MKWNWHNKQWPQFNYDEVAFSSFESQFLQSAGMMHGSFKHITREEKENLRIQLISDEAYKTSEIEGEILNRESLHSSIRRHFGLTTDKRKSTPAEQGIAEMLVDLYRTYSEDLTKEKLFSWHEMITNGRGDLVNIGSYRTHAEPMQIISVSIDEPKIHFEAPPSGDVPNEMKAFLDWFNQVSKSNSSILITAGIAHLYFESIHPFEDGNGRIGRAISEKALSRGLNRPTLLSLAQVIERKRKNYYQALQEASKGLDIQNWLVFFCEMVLEAQDYTQSRIDFLIWKSKFYEKFCELLNERQLKAVGRVFAAGVAGFKGGLSAENYLSMTQTSRATATRDLQKLVDMGAFRKIGDKRYTRYYLNGWKGFCCD